MTAATRGADIRAGLGHPVVDGDGHVRESWPVFVDYMRRVGGDDVVRRVEGVMASVSREPRPGTSILAWWTQPTNVRDRATSVCPRLLHERLDEIGIDFSILYSTLGLMFLRYPDDEVRQVACRALNVYLAEALDGLGDRMTP